MISICSCLNVEGLFFRPLFTTQSERHVGEGEGLGGRFERFPLLSRRGLLDSRSTLGSLVHRIGELNVYPFGSDLSNSTDSDTTPDITVSDLVLR